MSYNCAIFFDIVVNFRPFCLIFEIAHARYQPRFPVWQVE